jgi:hypothetical protein
LLDQGGDVKAAVREAARLLGIDSPGERTKRAEGDHEATTWPDPLSELAYHGLAGDIVRIIAPHSEAAPEAILIQNLTVFGTSSGEARSTWLRETSTRRTCSVFSLEKQPRAAKAPRGDG